MNAVQEQVNRLQYQCWKKFKACYGIFFSITWNIFSKYETILISRWKEIGYNLSSLIFEENFAFLNCLGTNFDF